MDPLLSNGSRGTLMSYTDHSVQRRLKSNAPIITECLLVQIDRLNGRSYLH